MAGLGVGFWTEAFIQQQYDIDYRFNSNMAAEQREKYLARWQKAINRTRGWLD